MMKSAALSLRPLLSALALCACAGCTRICVLEPIGDPITPDETFDVEGTWEGPDRETWTAVRIPGSSRMLVTHAAEGEPEEFAIRFTDIGDDIAILWVDVPELDAFLPLRIAPAQEGVSSACTLLFPDEDEVQCLVENGQILGRYDQAESAWILQPESLKSQFASHAFWRLDFALPLLKRTDESGAQDLGQTTNRIP